MHNKSILPMPDRQELKQAMALVSRNTCGCIVLCAIISAGVSQLSASESSLSSVPGYAKDQMEHEYMFLQELVKAAQAGKWNNAKHLYEPDAGVRNSDKDPLDIALLRRNDC